MNEKVILAYSGGLDTSVILKWLIEKGYDVIAYVANVGQKEDFKKIEEKALKTGASKVYIEDMREEFVTDFIFLALMGNAIYEGRYLLGTALARPLISKRQIEIAEMEKAKFVAHGATAKGNDQVRFELSYYALNPNIKVISPWKDTNFTAKFKGRSDLINYAKEKGIDIKATVEKPFSEDENLMHISHEAGILENPSIEAYEGVFTKSVSPMQAPDRETLLHIHFKDGVPIKIIDETNDVTTESPLEMMLYLNKVGEENGVGRVDMVENRYIGIKSRGIYETPGATILWKAHRDLEGIAMDKEVMHLRDSLVPKFSELIYNGLWFSPEMDFLLSAIKKSQEAINGKVTLSVYKGNVMPISRESSVSLYDEKLSSMDLEGGFNFQDASGFINITALRLKAHAVVLKKKNAYEWRKSLKGEEYGKTVEERD